MSEFHFLRPAWFLALIPALFVLLLWLRRRGRAESWAGIVSPALLPHLLLEEAKAVRRLPLAALAIGWLLGVTALAGPTWERQPQPVYRAPADRVIVLDMSPSMAAADLEPDRLTRARFAIRGLLSRAREGRTALVVFGSDPHVVTPLTDDVATIESLLPALTTDILPAPGDRAAPALRTAGELLERVGSIQGHVLLLSDGIGDPADTLDAIRELRRQGRRVAVVGVGTPEGAPAPAAQGGFGATGNGGIRLARLDEPGLQALANAGGGGYQRLGRSSLADLSDGSVGRNPTKAKANAQGVERWVEKGPWLLLPLILLAAGAFRRGWLAVLAVLILPPPSAHAFDWQGLWLRPDQQGARLLEQGDATAAAEHFRDPNWRATARYRAGDYAAAAEGFTGRDADSHYNRGNALARAGRLEDALAAYDDALERRPGNEDARFNRDLIERLMRDQQQSGQDEAEGSPNRAENEDGTQGKGQTDPGSGQGTSGEKGAQAMAEEPERTDSEPDQAASEEGGAPSGGPARDPDPDEHDAAEEGGALPGRQDFEPETAPGASDDATRARRDVAPTEDDSTRSPPDNRALAGEDGPVGPGEPPDVPADAVMSEREVALEQWLRQVPDDPSGLLRRKFMLEHLLRQRGAREP